jgi:O-antigen ligase
MLVKLAAYIALLVLVLTKGFRHVGERAGTAVFFAYAVFAAGSAVYSSVPMLAVGSGIALLAVSLVPALMSSWHQDGILSLWRALFVAGCVMAVASLLLYAFMPNWAVAHRVSGIGRLSGFTGAPNSLGNVLGATMLIGVYVYSSASGAFQRSGILLGLACSAVAALLTGSRTALLAFAVAMAAPYALRGIWTYITAIAAAILAAGMIAYPPVLLHALDALTAAFSRSGSSFELTTFTGRVEIWRASISLWWESPWIGYGLGSPRTVIPETWSNRWGGTTGTAHNFILESLVSFGVVGTSLLVTFLVTVAVTAFRTLSTQCQYPACGRLTVRLLVFVLVGGMMEKSFAGTLSPNTLLLALCYGTAVTVVSRR